MSNQDLKNRAEKVLLNNYGERKIALVRGQGVKVWDADGNEYLDFLSGLGVNNIGHCHPRVVKAIQEQAARLLHVSNLYLMEPQIELAELLTANTFADRVFFCNSGTEAVEAMMKLARRYASTVAQNNRTEILCFRNSFHGRTFGSMTATGQEKYHKGFAPLLPDVVYAEYNNLADVRAKVNNRTCAILVEAVQGEGGVNVGTPEFLRGLRSICDETGALLLADEVQCGFGRTGRFLGIEHSGITPDAAAMAKGLGGGVPIGAMLCTEKAAAALTAGTHAATFGGNPLATAAGCAAVRVMLEDNLPAQATEKGAYMQKRISDLCGSSSMVKNIRGLGLMIGVEVGDIASSLAAKMLERGILAGTAMGNTVRFLPPLIVTHEEIDHVTGIFADVLNDAAASMTSTGR